MDDSRAGPVPLGRRPRRHRFRGGFKTVELNVRGWSALLGMGLALGGIVVLATSAPPVVALPAGVLLTWGFFLVLDRHRDRNGMVNMGFGNMDAQAGAAIVASLQSMGIEASYFETPPEEDYEFETVRGISCRQADSEVVGRVTREHLR